MKLWRQKYISYIMVDACSYDTFCLANQVTDISTDLKSNYVTFWCGKQVSYIMGKIRVGGIFGEYKIVTWHFLRRKVGQLHYGGCKKQSHDIWRKSRSVTFCKKQSRNSLARTSRSVTLQRNKKVRLVTCWWVKQVSYVLNDFFHSQIRPT